MGASSLILFPLMAVIVRSVFSFVLPAVIQLHVPEQLSIGGVVEAIPIKLIQDDVMGRVIMMFVPTESPEVLDTSSVVAPAGT